MTDLIRRADALEAVDVAMLGAYRPTFERVVKALRALPSVPTPDVSPVPPTAQKIHETKDEKMHRKVTCGCMCHDFGGGPFHPNQHCRCRGGEGFDDLSAPATPSVGELEWETRKDRRTIARIKSGPWSVVDYPSGGCWLRFCDVSVKFCESEIAAKSLANSLQRILSGAAE